MENFFHWSGVYSYRRTFGAGVLLEASVNSHEIFSQRFPRLQRFDA